MTPCRVVVGEKGKRMRRQTFFRQLAMPTQEPVAFEPLGRAEVVSRTPQAVRLQCGRTTVEVTTLAADLFRVGMFGDARPVDYRSEAIATQDWPALAANTNAQKTDAGDLVIDTGAAAAVIGLDPLRIGFRDLTGRTFAVDDAARGMGFAPLAPAEPPLIVPLDAAALVYKQHLTGTRYFGCGERTGGLDKTGSQQVFWNVDPPFGHNASLNNLYTSVPFVVALQDGQAWGLFLDSSYRVEFDLANEDPTRCGFATAGGPLIYYVFAGPSPRAVLERYTQLTGRIPLPPRWALGYHQSRWGYKTAEQVVDIARTFRARDLPLDAIYLDIDYMDGYRVFTWSVERFPDPAGLVRQLADLGVKLVTIVDPGVKVDEQYPVYTSGRDADHFCKTFVGGEYHNVVWPGMCAFPDFTAPRTRAWWGDLLTVLLDAGVAGVWCDMNEPTAFIPAATTLPDDVVHRGEDEPKLHVQVHNLYGQLMARATHDGLRRWQPERRPFVISRAGFAGLQRYALHWTGDNTSWWEHLYMSMPQLQNLGLSGYAFVGVDIGGFAGDATGELLTRWVEFGIFEPFCRNHSAWNTRDQEPWSFGEPYESHIRRLLQLRQRLLPYLYTLFEEAHRGGAPVLRPLLFEYPSDETTYTADDQFLLGSALLVAPIARPGTEHRHVYLPHGTWVQYWTAERLAGPGHRLAHAPLGQPAVYVRANTPLPMWPPTRHASERAADPLTWLIFVARAEDGSAELYDDAGEGFAHETGDFLRTRLTCRVGESTVELDLTPLEGTYTPGHATVELDLRGLDRPTSVTVDDAASDSWEHAAGRLVIRLPRPDAPRRIRIQAALA
jgi:alpha-glucosidase